MMMMISTLMVMVMVQIFRQRLLDDTSKFAAPIPRRNHVYHFIDGDGFHDCHRCDPKCDDDQLQILLVLARMEKLTTVTTILSPGD